MSSIPTSEEMARYRENLRRRNAEDRQALVRRKASAWTLARQAAEVLKARYAATRVVVFGSLASEDRFHVWSDVDVAAWGVSPDQTFRAIAELLCLDSEIEINLVDVNTCRPSVLRRIEREGVEL